MSKNGDVKWAVLAPLLLGLAIACIGATKFIVDSEDRRLYNNIEQIKLDIRVIQGDVKLLLQKGGDL